MMRVNIAIYIFLWLFSACLIIFSYGGNAFELWTPDSMMYYLCSIVSICVTLVSVYVAIKMFKFTWITNKFNLVANEQKPAMYQKICSFRLVLLLAAELVDGAIWMLTGMQSTIFLLAIIMVTLFFCVPQRYVSNI